MGTLDLWWRGQGLPGSWGSPLDAFHALRPRWDLGARPLPRLGAAFRWFNGVGSHHRSISGLHRMAHGPRCLRFAGWVTPYPRKTRFRLAASFAGQGLNL